MAERRPPVDLCDAQLRLHQVWAEYEALGRTLPWSVVPAQGWTSTAPQYSSYRRDVPATEGYTEQQKRDKARLWRQLQRLSVTVGCHRYWLSMTGEEVVEARMELKRMQGALSPDWTDDEEDEPAGEELAEAV